MSIITRPIKTGGGTDVVKGNDVLANEWNGDMNTIYSDHNGKITNANIDPTAAIAGNTGKIASKPSGIGTDQINAKAVTSIELANDATVDVSRAVGPDHIKNVAIIARHLKVNVFNWNPGVGVILANKQINKNTGLSANNVIPLLAQIKSAGLASEFPASEDTHAICQIVIDTNDSNRIWLRQCNQSDSLAVDRVVVELLYIEAA